ncbi:hypothetical protein PHMEG_00023490, partial [Phytophthora megakarya]
ISDNQGIHHLASRETTCPTLVQVIHAGQLDETSWCCFVPEAFYISAEAFLERRQVNREPTHLVSSGSLLHQGLEAETVNARHARSPSYASASSDDEIQDPSYEISQAELDKAERAETAAENDESSEGLDVSRRGSESEAAGLRPPSPRDSKTVRKSSKDSRPENNGPVLEFQAPGHNHFQVLGRSATHQRYT